jgi:hypothetical protein
LDAPRFAAEKAECILHEIKDFINKEKYRHMYQAIGSVL